MGSGQGAERRPHFSASQVEAFLLCPRKWHFRWVMGRTWPKTKALTFGTEIAEELEHWWRDGSPLKHRLAKAASKLVASPGTAECYVEQACEFSVIPGWLWVGRVDFLDLRDKGCPTITDYKTTKLREYAKSAADLAVAVQMISYARWLFLGAEEVYGQKSPVQTVRLKHIYMEKEGPGDVWPEEVIVTPEHVAHEWAKVEGFCRRMAELREVRDANKIQLPPNFGFAACRTYGACPHIRECSRERDNSSFFDDMDENMVDKKKLRAGVIPPDAPDPYKHQAMSQGELGLSGGKVKKSKLDALVAKQRVQELRAAAEDAEFSFPPLPEATSAPVQTVPEEPSAPPQDDPEAPPAPAQDALEVPPAPVQAVPEAPPTQAKAEAPDVLPRSAAEAQEPPQDAPEAPPASVQAVPEDPSAPVQAPQDKMAAAMASVAAADKVMASPGSCGPLVISPGVSKFTLYVNCLPYRPLTGRVVTLDDYVAALQARVIEAHPQRAPDVRVGEKGYEILAVAAEKHLPDCDVVLATTGTLTATSVIEVLRRHAAQTWVGTR